MPFVAQIGDTVQTLAEAMLQWKIYDFFSLSDKVDDYYDSPDFNFDDSRWYLRLYPNGESDLSTEEFLSLYICRRTKNPLKMVNFTFGILSSDGRVEEIAEESEDFSAENNSWGNELWSRSKLRQQATKFMPGNYLTITCLLKCKETSVSKVSLSDRVWKVSRNLKKILNDGKRSDFTLKLGDRQWPVHKLVLESRCEYFANVFRHEWAENTAGEVKFEDIEEDALDNVLNFIYSGDVEDMSVKNVCDIYVAAHKFLLDDLRTLCVEFMKENLCLEMFCKVLLIAGTYDEGDLNQTAVEYFCMKVDQIFDSEEWKKLKRNHPSVVAEFLEETTKRVRKKETKGGKKLSS